MKPKDLARREQDAMALLQFSLQLGRIQQSAGRAFVHEHPAKATSWRVPELVNMINSGDFNTLYFDMCRFGLRSPHGALMKKPTMLLYAGLPNLREYLGLRCRCIHRHQLIMGPQMGIKLSRHAQIYTPAFVDALVRAAKEHADSQRE